MALAIERKTGTLEVQLGARETLDVALAASGALPVRMEPTDAIESDDGSAPAALDAGDVDASTTRRQTLDVAVSWDDTLEVLVAGASRIEAKIPLPPL